MLDIRNAFPETAKDWAVRNANVIRSVVIFGSYALAFLMFYYSFTMGDPYATSCSAALIVTMCMKHLMHPHLAGGVKNEVLESDENMEKRQTRWNHDIIHQYFSFCVLMTPWAVLWVYANWISPLLG